jgi:hypothetical protein
LPRHPSFFLPPPPTTSHCLPPTSHCLPPRPTASAPRSTTHLTTFACETEEHRPSESRKREASNTDAHPVKRSCRGGQNDDERPRRGGRGGESRPGIESAHSKVRTLVIDGNRHRRLPSIRRDLHPISSSLTTSTGQRPRTLPAAHHHGDTRRQRRGDATSPTAERALAASRPQPSSTPRQGDYMARQRSPPDVPRRLPVVKHTLGAVHSSNDNDDDDTPHIPFIRTPTDDAT